MSDHVTSDEQDSLAAVVREVEAHASRSGWDRPAQLFALVETADLVRREPQLAALLGLEGTTVASGHLTPVEQDPVDETLEEVLPGIVWPPEVSGTAVVLEATTVDREETRIVAGVLRTGESWCAIRQRAHDEDDLVLTGGDLVPGLLQLLRATLDADSPAGSDPYPMNGPDDELP